MDAMPAPLAPPAVDPATLSTLSPAPAADFDAVTHALETLLLLLRAPLQSDDASRLTELHSARRAVATAIDRRAAPLPRGPLTEALLAASDALSAHPAGALAHDVAAAPPASSGRQAALVRLFAAPAWQTPYLRPISEQPDWFWASYTRYVFAVPSYFQTTDQESRWTGHILAHLEPLVRMLEANRGSSSARMVARLVVTGAARWPAVGSAEQLRRRQHALGRLRTLLAPRLSAYQSDAQSPPPASPLRVGLLCDATLEAPGIFDPVQLKTLLDPERIELTVYTANDLPSDTAEQVNTLRRARLDAVVFGGDVTVAGGPLSDLAVHRVAPRQFATALCPHTTGLPEVDMFLADAAAHPAAYTEKIAVLPAALAFSLPPPTEEPTLTRSDFGLPNNASLFATTVHPAHFEASTRARWRELLATDPEARLVVLPAASGPALELLLADLGRDFGERLIIAGDAPLPATALAALLRVINTYVPSTAPSDRSNRELAQSLGLRVPGAPARIDCLAFADALTTVLENACRTPDAPLIASAVSCDFATRHEQGNQLLACGRPDRAVVYLLAAVDDPQAGPDVWHDLALALHANQQSADAIQALETCVQMAPDRLESWLLLADWAAAYGHDELMRDIAAIVSELAPADPRVTALAERSAV